MIFDWSGQFPITQNMGLSEFSSQDDFSYECVSLLFARWNGGLIYIVSGKPISVLQSASVFQTTILSINETNFPQNRNWTTNPEMVNRPIRWSLSFILGFLYWSQITKKYVNPEMAARTWASFENSHLKSTETQLCFARLFYSFVNFLTYRTIF